MFSFEAVRIGSILLVFLDLGIFHTLPSNNIHAVKVSNLSGTSWSATSSPDASARTHFPCDVCNRNRAPSTTWSDVVGSDLKRFGVIHSSKTSQPPRFTPCMMGTIVGRFPGPGRTGMLCARTFRAVNGKYAPDVVILGSRRRRSSSLAPVSLHGRQSGHRYSACSTSSSRATKTATPACLSCAPAPVTHRITTCSY